MALNLLDCTVCGAFALILWVIRSRGNRLQSLPPGPPPKPLIGNYLHVSEAELWKTISQWREHYGLDPVLQRYNLKYAFNGLNRQPHISELFRE